MAISKQIFAAAVAQKIGPHVAATWSPLVPRTPRVLVPIRVDALVVRQKGGTWADCRMREPDPGDSHVAAKGLLPAPFTDLPEARDPGVYLHWALPDALTRGIASADPAAGVTFPAIPDRWLVLRIGGSDRSLSRRSVTGWVIENGGRAPKVSPLAGWTEPGPEQATGEGGAPGVHNRPIKPLTALGHGDPAWAAYFDNVTNRLGFVDPLSGVSRGPLAYLVCGWYADPARDVLGDAITSVTKFERRIAELRWEVPDGAFGHAYQSYSYIMAAAAAGLPTREAPTPSTSPRSRAPNLPMMEFSDANAWIAKSTSFDFARKPIGGVFEAADGWWPKYTLYHGGIVGLGWPNPGIAVAGSVVFDGDEVGGPPPANKVQVAFGHSLTDAMAAMLAANDGTPDKMRALEMALLGASDDLNMPDAAGQVDVRVHAASFGALPTPPTTETIRQMPLAPPAPPRRPDPSKTDSGIFDGRVPKAGKSKMSKPAKGSGLAEASVRESANTKSSKVKVWSDRSLIDVVAEMNGKKSIRGGLNAGATPDPTPREVEVARAAPRFFFPNDPVVLVQGADRVFKHGGDGLNSETGKLPCRVSGMVTHRLAPGALKDHPGEGVICGADLLQRGVGNGSVPPECDQLLSELALLDPGSAMFAARVGGRGKSRLSTRTVNRAAKVYAVEQTAWWATWDPRRDSAVFTAKSGFEGMLPCGLAITAPLKPWVPLHLDWEVEYVPSANGVDDWQLGEIDFDGRPDTLPGPDTHENAIVLSGRALLTGGAAQVAAAAVRQTLEKSQSAGGSASLTPGTITQFHSQMAQTILARLSSLSPPRGRSSAARGVNADDLRSLADALAEMDVLAGALDNFHTRLRGGFLGDGHAKPDDGAPLPEPFVALRAGFLRVRRLRLVDCFGQTLDLAGSSAGANADMTQVVRSEPMTVTGRPDLLELAPRFTAPARLMLRFVKADDDAIEATDAQSPVCGFLLPDHLDAELQFHGADGTAFGSVRFDAAAGVCWEDAPGLPTAVGADPGATIANTHLAGVARGLLDWGVADVTRDDPDNSDTALSALLRIIDTTLWTVDPFGHTGDEHLSLLVGHPVAVMRARLSLEVAETIRTDAMQSLRIPVRLGSLAHWQDGLLGYFVDDDYTTFYPPDPAAAGFARPIGPGKGFLQQATQTSNYYTEFASEIGVNAIEGNSPVTHDFADSSGVIFIRPGQTIALTLLVEPHSVVNATSGLLPRKAIGMRRQWVAPGLANIAPIFRFGPVLVEAKRIRMPVASDMRGTWSWCHRVDPTTWQEQEVINSRGDTQLPTSPVEGQEGWLRLTPEKPAGGG